MNAVMKPASDESFADEHGAVEDAASVASVRTPDPVAIQLVVQTGLQAGATVVLPSGVEHSVGGAREDVRLRDPALCGASIVLSVHADGIHVRQRGGKVLAADQLLSPNELTVIAPGESLALGDVQLSLQVVPQAQEQTTPSRLPVAAAASTLPSVVAAQQAPTGRNLARLCAVALAVSAMALTIWWSAGGQQQEPQSLVQASDLLHVAEFADLVVSEEAGRVVIDGVLPGGAERASLDVWLRRHAIEATNRVETDASLASKVLDVLRVNGADAELVSSMGGDVIVTTALPTTVDTDALVELVRSDVPALASLTLENAPPPVPFSGVNDPGKRIAMVVSDDPAHIVTVDETRYFEGSVLSSGYRIEDISDGEVTIVRGDQRTILDF